jgi:hypothetical protein
MPAPRALLLALALEAAPTGRPRLTRFARHKTAFVATLLVEPAAYVVKALVPTDDGLEVLWQQTSPPRLDVHVSRPHAAG